MFPFSGKLGVPGVSLPIGYQLLLLRFPASGSSAHSVVLQLVPSLQKSFTMASIKVRHHPGVLQGWGLDNHAHFTMFTRRRGSYAPFKNIWGQLMPNAV